METIGAKSALVQDLMQDEEGTMEKPRLLITEDEHMLRDLLSYVLRDHFQVHITNNGLEAIRFLQGNRVDLILLDLVLPIVNGLEVLNWIKENEIDVPILLMSSYDMNSIPYPFEELKIKGFIHKPFEIKSFLRHVREAIESHQLGKDSSADRRVSERRSMVDRRKGERRSLSNVDPCLIFNGETRKRKGVERRKSGRRDAVDRRSH